MQSTTLNSEIKLRKAEQFLGSKRKRYFASGYKQIYWRLCNYQYSNETLSASLEMDWGRGWSVKTGRHATRHIGSIESFSVAIRLLELFLIVKYNLNDHEIASSFIRKIEFKTKPGNHQNDRPLDVKVTNFNTESVNDFSVVGKFNIVVDNFYFVVEIDFNCPIISVVSSYERFLNSITSNPEHYYGQAYKLTSIDIENLVLNIETRSVIAVSKVNRLNSKLRTGIGTSNLGGVTFIDFLSISGQLTQILLYKLDNTTREDSSNMWVRSFSAEFSATNQLQVVLSKANFTEFNLVKLKGEIWRLATAQFEIGSIVGVAKVCHILNNR